MQRFFNKIKKGENPNDCWIWIGGIRGKCGYGAFKLRGKTISAHRLSFELEYGRIPDGLLIMHTCDNRRCVNPLHLLLGDFSTNAQDAYIKGRMIPPKSNSKGKPSPLLGHTSEFIQSLKEAIRNRHKENKTLMQISLDFNVKYQFVRDVSCGKICKNI